MRGKNFEDETWTALEDDAFTLMNTVHIECKREGELCNYFPVGYVPALDYDMYDVAV